MNQETHIHIPTFDGLRLFCRFWEGEADGDIIVYCHGLQSHSEWATGTAQYFQKYGFNFYAFDRRGSGKSQGRKGDCKSYMQFITDLVQVINFAKDKHPGRRVHLMGLCWGARLGLILSLFYPRLIDSMILIAPGAVTKKTIPFPEKFLFPVWILFKPKKYIRIPLSSEMFTQNEPHLSYIRQDKLKLRFATARFFWESFKMQILYCRRAHRISMPIFILLAQKDVIVNNKRVIDIYHKLGSIKKSIKIYPGAFHSLEFEKNNSQILWDIYSWIRDISDTLPADCTKLSSAVCEKIEVFETNIPFKRKFSHALAERNESGSLMVKVLLTGGITGYGEGLPRPYVTGETIESAVHNLKNDLVPKVLGQKFSSYADVISFCRKFTYIPPAHERPQTSPGAAWTALELALLDAYGAFFNRSLADICGSAKQPTINYSGVISSGSLVSSILAAIKMKLYGFRHVKVKVGLNNDTTNLKYIRAILGGSVSLRADANCAWDRNEAYNWIKSVPKLNLSSLEQPLAKNDFEGLTYLAKHSHLSIMADESLITLQDARKLIGLKCCHMFNIRISKCGGIIHALEIKKFADAQGIRCQLGCQVGESGILSAAGRYMACAFNNLEFIEGSYERLLLTEDIVYPRVNFSRQGKAYFMAGRGLGIFVKEDILRKFITNTHTFSIRKDDKILQPSIS